MQLKHTFKSFRSCCDYGRDYEMIAGATCVVVSLVSLRLQLISLRLVLPLFCNLQELYKSCDNSISTHKSHKSMKDFSCVVDVVARGFYSSRKVSRDTE